MNLATRRRQQHLSAQHYLGLPMGGSALQRTVALIAGTFRVPVVQVNVLDAEKQVTVAAFGAGRDTIDRSESLCQHVVTRGRLTTLADINPVPAGATSVRTFVGAPLVGREGLVIGSLCLVDYVEHQFTATHLADLKAAATIVQDQLDLLRRLAPHRRNSAVTAGGLTTAVDQGQIVPHFQPIVDLRTDRISGVEALARWHHPDHGLIAPDQFIPLAEDSDIIVDLDLSVLRQAATQLTRWRTRFPRLRLNANLSARHFEHPGWVDRLSATVAETGCETSAITLELTETVALAADPDQRKALNVLRQAGFQVVLDDFGSGFSSVLQIVHLPIDGLKIDRTLTAAMQTRPGEAVVRHLIALATELELTTTVEGIETSADILRARRAGADLGQGHIWAPALSAADLTTLLAEGR